MGESVCLTVWFEASTVDPRVRRFVVAPPV